ncbi:MAG: UDP-N-acetylmuramoyl-L-alanine--D-glutamate ligase [Bacteroidales bacterium]|nr:UDP-N-acetylmuramoyl-L-alanine--D-glutamate ligase [Bacteroidales bacterium]
MNANRNKYNQVLVLGAGESGIGAALLAVKNGLEVFVSDAGKIRETYRSQLVAASIPFEEGGHSRQRIEQAELIVKSPGIPDNSMALAGIDRHKIISEIEFASWFTNAKIIAVTGSNGKTTTTLLLGHILRQAGFDVGVAGNVGPSFAACLSQNDHEYFVLELSSFQLDGIRDLRPDVAILTNITPDHLDRYGNSFEAYARSKFRITQNQLSTDYFIYCYDDPETTRLLKETAPAARCIPFASGHILAGEGAYEHHGILRFEIQQNTFDMTLEQLALQGRHNVYNSLAAGLASKIIGIRNETIKMSLSDCQNVAHRLEYVANVHGAAYYNDSKATNVNSTWYALEMFDRPIVWIAGGIDKGNDYSQLLPLVSRKVKALICLGRDNSKLIEAFEGVVETIVETQSAEHAVSMASLLSEKNDVVLLSPACASFDLFENYEDRGNQFKKAVRSL